MKNIEKVYISTVSVECKMHFYQSCAFLTPFMKLTELSETFNRHMLLSNATDGTTAGTLPQLLL